MCENVLKEIISTIASLPDHISLYITSYFPNTKRDLQDLLNDCTINMEILSIMRANCVQGMDIKITSNKYETKYKIIPKYPTHNFRGSPAQTDELLLCSSIGLAYWESTGKNPYRWRNEDNRGPFNRMLSKIFELIGIDISIDDLIRKYNKLMKPKECI